MILLILEDYCQDFLLCFILLVCKSSCISIRNKSEIQAQVLSNYLLQDYSFSPLNSWVINLNFLCILNIQFNYLLWKNDPALANLFLFFCFIYPKKLANVHIDILSLLMVRSHIEHQADCVHLNDCVHLFAYLQALQVTKQLFQGCIHLPLQSFKAGLLADCAATSFILMSWVPNHQYCTTAFILIIYLKLFLCVLFSYQATLYFYKI